MSSCLTFDMSGGLGLGFVANRFDVVPIWTDDESCIVVGVVVRAQTRRTIVFATCLQSRAIEGFDLLAILGRECQVKMRRLLHGLEHAQGSLTVCTKLDTVRRLALRAWVYRLRTTLVEQDNATLWRTYTMLTTLESVFRSLKIDLGLRPVFHRVERRVEGHLFISVLAYHFVRMLRLQLKARGIDDSWQTVRDTLATQQRVTVTVQRRDGRTVHVRKASRPEPQHQKINTILGHTPNPGGTHRALV